MLVLSRRPNEKIVFANLGITVEICSVARSTVRVGIDAPTSVQILRGELAPAADPTARPPGSSPRHHLRNRLNTANLAIYLAQKQLSSGLIHEAERSLNEALSQFSQLDQELADSTPAARAKREIRALLVEDNNNESALLAEFLRLHGITVEIAHDGQDALDYLRSHDRPDVVLLDMRMPRCDGPTTVAAIRGNAAYDGLKVFAVSGADPQECTLPNGSRIDGWFRKPLDPGKLISEMNLVLGRN
jgi:carbon storage regulator CsrA